MPHPSLLHSEPLPLQQFAADLYLHRRQTQSWPSPCGVSGSWCTQALFEPSKHLWRVWGLIQNVISPLLPSCWGSSFALGHGVSFLVGSNSLQSTLVQQCVVILAFSQEMSACSSTPPSWTGTLPSILCLQNCFQCYYHFGEITNLAALQKNSLLSWQGFVAVVVYSEVCARCCFKCYTYYFIISFMRLFKVYIWKQ